jgi:hypothetical protein
VSEPRVRTEFACRKGAVRAAREVTTDRRDRERPCDYRLVTVWCTRELRKTHIDACGQTAVTSELGELGCLAAPEVDHAAPGGKVGEGEVE